MRIALVHDWLIGMRGGERVLEELIRAHPSADLFTLIHVPGATSPLIESRPIRASFLSRLPGIGRHHQLALPLFPTAIRRLDLTGYDLVISCSHAVAKSVRVPPGALHLSYCLTPMRYVWDLRETYQGTGLVRRLGTPLNAYLQGFDRRTEEVDRFLTISTAVQERVARHYGRESHVVHPPVDTHRFRANGRPPEDFYLLVTAFTPYKQVGLALEAFRLLGRRLVVVGDGPARRLHESRAPANVEFVGRIDDAELARLYASCRALVSPQEEDFGLAAVEAQASGRPVITYGRGGAVDTVRPLREDEETPTGVWFDRQQPTHLAQAVRDFEKHEGRFQADVFRLWAERFSAERFQHEFQSEIRALTQ
ncbi:MAG: glycosyltransferase [Myxococcota bacterium]|nr:glycosyltransferase [Myxococcota bacterium]